VFATLSLGVMPAAAQTASFQQGAAGYAGTVDTFIQTISPNATAGSGTEIQVDRNAPGSLETDVTPSHGLLRFADLFGSGLAQVPTGAVIQSATLSLYTSNVSTGSFNMHRMLTSWDENSTWNSFGGDGVSLGLDAETTPSATFIPSASGTIQLDVTADLQAWSAGATNLGWGFLTTSTNGWDFTSANGLTLAERPSLTVNFVAIPEPSAVTFLLGGVAALAALVLRRRRQA